MLALVAWGQATDSRWTVQEWVERHRGVWSMTEILRRFSTSNLTVALWIIILAWLIWPILCGILGARRGQGMQGVIQGLLWGPVGLLIVLFRKQKHPCPTCGHKTLSHPVSPAPIAPAATSTPPPVATVAQAPPVVSESTPEPTSVEDRKRVLEEACAGYSEEEKKRLYAWVNAE